MNYEHITLIMCTYLQISHFLGFFKDRELGLGGVISLRREEKLELQAPLVSVSKVTTAVAPYSKKRIDICLSNLCRLQVYPVHAIAELAQD